LTFPTVAAPEPCAGAPTANQIVRWRVDLPDRRGAGARRRRPDG